MLADGPVTTEQRRRFVRVPVVGRAAMHHVLHARDDAAEVAARDPGELKLDAEMVDLSEGGACVRAAARPWVGAGREVRLELDVDGVAVVQLAEVLRVRPVPGSTSLDADRPQDAVLEFVEPVPVQVADRVRRYVMRIQIENRRRGER
nr:PilZ domain-containing protein [Kineococcus siccus]